MQRETGTYIRTVVLTKGNLDETVSASGTVESMDVSDVTTSLSYTVKSIAVQVGDIVEEGDIICELDSSELATKIEKAEAALQENIDKAYQSYIDALNEKAEAETAVSEAESALMEKETALNTAKTEYETVVSSVQSYQTAYDQAAAAQQEAGKNLNATPEVTDQLVSEKRLT